MALVCCCSWPAAVRMMHGTVRHRSFARKRLERLTPIVRKRDAKGALLELHFDDAPNVGFVVGNQHMVGRSGAGHDRLDEGGDVFSIAPQLEEQLTDVGTWGDEDEEY